MVSYLTHFLLLDVIAVVLLGLDLLKDEGQEDGKEEDLEGLGDEDALEGRDYQGHQPVNAALLAILQPIKHSDVG